MAALFTVVLFVIFIAVVASLYTEGMWSNAIAMINVVTAGLVATNYFEPFANWIEGIGELKAYTYLWDFLALWVLFVVSITLMRLVTDKISRINVAFLHITDRLGGVLFACLTAWVMVCFTTFTLHTAPLGKNFLFGGFQTETPMMVGLGPDLKWLQLNRSLSKGAFCRSPVNTFDPYGEFRAKYERRRAQFEAQIEETGSVGKTR